VFAFFITKVALLATHNRKNNLKRPRQPLGLLTLAHQRVCRGLFLFPGQYYQPLHIKYVML